MPKLNCTKPKLKISCIKQMRKILDSYQLMATTLLITDQGFTFSPRTTESKITDYSQTCLLTVVNFSFWFYNLGSTQPKRVTLLSILPTHWQSIRYMKEKQMEQKLSKFSDCLSTICFNKMCNYFMGTASNIVSIIGSHCYQNYKWTEQKPPL